MVRDYLTVKFLPQGGKGELQICNFIRKHSRSPFVSTIQDHFAIPHHLSLSRDHRFKGMEFDAMVYPTTGSCLHRILSKSEYVESPYLPLNMERRESCIRQVVCGMAELHRIGVVHGGG